VVSQLVKAMTKQRIYVQGARVLVMGLAFKENCPDLRNTKIIDIVRELSEYDISVDIYDPWVSTEEAIAEYGVSPIQYPEVAAYDAILVAVAHREFSSLGAAGIRKFGKPEHVLYDLKYLFKDQDTDMRL